MSKNIWQLRTFSEETLQDVVRNVGKTIAESIRRELENFDLDEQDLFRLQLSALKEIGRYIKPCKACGKHPACTFGFTDVTDLDVEERIYLLKLPEGFTGFVQDLSSSVLKSFLPCEDQQSFQNLARRVEAGVSRLLKLCVLKNPECGKHLFCSISNSYLQ